MRKLQNRSKGFTIIELLIVLAIAALIILIVLIAVPQLQRNQRNTARQNIAGRIATEINNYAGNNNGNTPTENADATTGFTGGFANRYLSNIDINDPQTGQPVGSGSGGVAFAFTGATEPGGTPGNLLYGRNRICNGEIATGAGANARNFVLVIRLEGGAGYCLDNS